MSTQTAEATERIAISDPRERIISVDALRGLAMFMILATQIGGAPIFKTFVNLFGKDFANAANASQLSWTNPAVTILNIPQSIFIFVVGLVIPFSLGIRLQRTPRATVYRHVIIRSVILFFLGTIAGGHLLEVKLERFYYYNNVLEYIGVGYLCCSLLVMNSTWRMQAAVTAGLMLLVWAIYLFIPAPGWQGDRFSHEMNIGIYLDQVVLGSHGHPFKGHWAAFLNTFGQTANMLLGVLMGQILFSSRPKPEKAKVLSICGVAMWVAGAIWGLFYPVLRSNMTGSYVLEACGIATLLLALFYVVIDMWGHSKWAFFFIVFGANSIAIYMMAHLFKFNLISDIVVGGACRFLQPNIQNFIQAVAAMTVMWLIMYYMYRKKTFIKV